MPKTAETVGVYSTGSNSRYLLVRQNGEITAYSVPENDPYVVEKVEYTDSGYTIQESPGEWRILNQRQEDSFFRATQPIPKIVRKIIGH